MNYVLQNAIAYDTVQLLDSNNNPVSGVLFSDVEVYIRKNGETGFSSKALIAGDLVEIGSGSYRIKFEAADLDTLGLFRHYIIGITAAFTTYQSALYVCASLPTFPSDPPTINSQLVTPPGISPDPVRRGSTLTITGTNLGGALSVTVNSIACTITSNTDTEIQATVPASMTIGTHTVQVTTAGGSATSTVEVIIALSEIPGTGFILLTGTLYSTETGTVLSNASVYGRILDMPNLAMGVGWSTGLKTATTNANGYFELQMPRGVRVEVSIPKIGYNRVFTTPDFASKNLFTEIP